MTIQEFRDKGGEGVSGTVSTLLSKRYLLDDRICVFKPKVQVLDNWGWCNGTCDGENGCYGSSLGNERPDNQCDGEGDDSDPWTEYNGYIIIAPEQ